jgi:hypothetical protein
MKNFFFPAVCFLWMMVSCNKAVSTHTSPVAMNAAFKNAFNFSPGSYWVYYDSLSGSIDSFVVVGNTNGHQLCTINSVDCDCYTVNMREYNTMPGIYDSATLIFFLTAPDTLWLEYISSPNTITGGLRKYAYTGIRYPFSSKDRAHADSFVSRDTVVQWNESLLMVGSSVYDNVSAISIHGDFSLNGAIRFNDTFFVAANDGIVKMFMHHPLEELHKHWVLLRKHVVR